MLRKIKKILGLFLTVSMLMSLLTVGVFAADTVTEVIVDTTTFNGWNNGYNRVFLGLNSLTNDSNNNSKIHGDTNGCATCTANTANTKGFFKIGKATGTPNTSLTSGTVYSFASATTPMYISVDVYGDALTDIWFSFKLVDISSYVTSSMLNANSWNKVSVIYYPNTVDNTKLGYADLYVNGKYVSTQDKSTSASINASECRVNIKVSDTTTKTYFDNIKVYALDSFTKPSVTPIGDITVEDGVISNYGRTTVSELESALGVDIRKADGTDASGSATVESGMTTIVSKTVTECVSASFGTSSVGTLSAEYEFGDSGYTDISEVLVDSSGYTELANSWNRVVIGPGLSTSTQQNKAGDSNASLKITNTNASNSVRFGVYKCVWNEAHTSTSSVKIGPFQATDKPIYWSVDVYADGAATNFQMQSAGARALGPVVTSEMLNANAWNTFALVYYPNTVDGTKLGYTDFYLNGKFVSTRDLSTITKATSTSSGEGSEYRFAFTYTDGNDTVYIDNLRVYEINGFARPSINPAGDILVENGEVLNYGDMTVSEFETALGVDVHNADGTDATGSASVVSGMKAVVSNELIGVGILCNEYDIGRALVSTITNSIVDTTVYNGWGNGYNRVILIEDNMERDTSHNVNYQGDTNGCYLCKANTADSNCYFTIGVLNGTPNVSTSQGGNLNITSATAPVYISLDMYGPSVTELWFTNRNYTQDNMSSTITGDMLASGWNTITLVYYPDNSSDIYEGYADLYLNGKFVSTTDLSGTLKDYLNNVRVYFKSSSTETYIAFDNIKAYQMNLFERPEIVAEGVTAENNTLTEYCVATVSELEEITGADIVNANGTDATASALPIPTMVAKVSNNISALDKTFVHEYVLGAGAYRVGDWSCTVDGTPLVGNRFTTAGELTAEIPVLNCTGESVTFGAILAEYKDNRMTHIKITTPSVATGNDTATITDTLRSGYVYELFAWKLPLTEAIPLRDVLTLTEQQ